MAYAPILVDTETAEVWTGRPAGTLYRWASEGRITRHGTRGTRLWNLRELPERSTGTTPQPADLTIV